MQIVVDGILTNYEIVGNKQQVLLILPGWKRSYTEWLPFARALEDTYKVILLDLPGFGQTPRPTASYSIFDYATFVEHFLTKLSVKKISLLGHSFGGRIGIILSAKTNKVHELVLVNSAAIETKSFLMKSKIAINKLAIMPVKIVFPHFAEKLKLKFGSDDYQSAGNLRDIFINTVNTDLSPLLHDIQSKTLIIWGDKDPIRPLSEGKFIEKSIPNAKLRIVWGAAHNPFLEKPKEFLEIVEENIC